MKATTATVSFNWNYCKAVTEILTNAVIAQQQPLIHMAPGIGSNFIIMLFFFLSFFNYLFQFALFTIQVCFFSTHSLFCKLKLFGFLCYFFRSIFNMLFTQLFFKLLHFNLFIDGFKLTVILYILTLLFIFFDQSLCFLYSFFLLLNELLDSIDLFFNTRLPCM